MSRRGWNLKAGQEDGDRGRKAGASKGGKARIAILAATPEGRKLLSQWGKLGYSTTVALHEVGALSELAFEAFRQNIEQWRQQNGKG